MTPTGTTVKDAARVNIIEYSSQRATGCVTASASSGPTMKNARHPSAMEIKPSAADKVGGSPRQIVHRCHLTRGRMGRPSGPTAIVNWPHGMEPPTSRSRSSAPMAAASRAGNGGTCKEGTPAV